MRLQFAALLLALLAVAARADVPVPTLEGPVTGGNGQPFIASTTFDLAQIGYVQEEFFISGTASAYVNSGPLGADGKWTVTPGATAPYKTRLLVYRPTKAKRFNGTVVVEWLNVSGGLDSAPDWLNGHVELLRGGFAWIGVSAQVVGVEGGPGLVTGVSQPLKTVDPARYGSLVHPGDSFAYDMFSQAGAAVRHPGAGGPDPLGGLEAKRFVAAGESQSAFEMVNYIDAVHPLAHVFDGYFVHSRSAFPWPLSQAPQPAISSPGSTLIRDDLDVPVLEFQTETDLTFLNSYSTRQDDTARFRLWEVAGTSHADAYTIGGMMDLGHDPAVVAPVLVSSAAGGFVVCPEAFNSGPQHFVVNAALEALDRWVRRGTPPKKMPRLDANAGPTGITLVADAHGNAEGGIRTPQVDVPIATFTGHQAGSILCQLFGTTTLFDQTTLATLYPGHRAFVSRYDRAAKHAVKTGALLEPDAQLIVRWAAQSDVGKP
jgi:hypothetical protein